MKNKSNIQEKKADFPTGKELIKAITETAIKLHREPNGQERDEYQNTFPISAFPKAIQEIVNVFERELNFLEDYTATAILFASSVSLGKSCQVKVKGTWIEKAIFYFALVGFPGTNKTHPLNTILKPLFDSDFQHYEYYKIQLSEYEAELEAYNSKNKKDKVNEKKPQKPNRFQRLLQDFTTETIVPIHEVNPNGLGVYSDELATWINNFSRYSKGSDESFWLSVWNGKELQVDRKTAGSFFIKDSFISVIGTIQPDVVSNLMKNRTTNGFIDRILFAYPDDLSKKKIKDGYTKPDYFENWERILAKITDLPNKTNEPIILLFDEAGKQAYYAFQHENTDKVNDLQEEGNILESGILSKFDIHVLRFALILEVLFYACGEGALQAVTERSVKGAVELAKYFQNTALRCVGLLNPKTKGLALLSGAKRVLFEHLENEFSTDEAERLADRLKISRRSLFRFLKNYNLFEKTQHGKYRKKIF